MFIGTDGKEYDCPYCHNQGENSCYRGVLVGDKSKGVFSIELEGTKITASWSEEIKPGDTYIAQKNTGWKLLTCQSVNPEHWICPKENAYSYDTWECAKVLSLN